MADEPKGMFGGDLAEQMFGLWWGGEEDGVCGPVLRGAALVSALRDDMRRAYKAGFKEGLRVGTAESHQPEEAELAEMKDDYERRNEEQWTAARLRGV